jgi:predicted nuclease of restriction endonuclease-like (RecB) superfamily
MGKRSTKRSNVLAKQTAVTRSAGALLDDVRAMIQAARLRTAQAVNAGLVALYWGVGERIRREVLKEKRASYGEEIVAALSRELTREFGRGFGESGLWRMVQFAEVFPEQDIVATLSRELGWSHFVELIPLPDPLRRDFYAEMCRIERWSVRTLRQKINGMLFERTAISKKPEKVIRQELDALRDSDRVTPDLVFRDPYVLDFLGLTGAYAEKDLEAGILREMERFILELGSDFAFVARQKRITVDNEDYYLDLLFYHRRLRRLVAVDLKLGKFQAADKGQMELYLRSPRAARPPAGRGGAGRADPVRRQVRPARRTARPHRRRHPSRRIPDRPPPARGAGAQAAGRRTPGPPAAGGQPVGGGRRGRYMRQR